MSAVGSTRFGRGAFSLMVVGTAAFLLVAQAFGQQGIGVAAPASTDAPAAEQGTSLLSLAIQQELKSVLEKAGAVAPPPMYSLFFTSWQHALLQEARAGFVTRMPMESEINKRGGPDANRPRAIRELSVGGILFVNADDWTVWLNKKRVTPKAIPSEAIDIRVSKEYVELKWFDRQTNQIFPVRIRSNQRFNLDARMFLPGESDQVDPNGPGG